MKHKKQWMGLALGFMLLGFVGLFATQYALADLIGQEDEEDVEYEEYDEEYIECDEYDREEIIYNQIDLLYAENEYAFTDLEGSLEALYEDLDSAVEIGSDAEIASVVKQIYEKEAALEALEEESGIAQLYDEIDSLYEEDEFDRNGYSEEDEEEFDEDGYAFEDGSKGEFDEEEE